MTDSFPRSRYMRDNSAFTVLFLKNLVSHSLAFAEFFLIEHAEFAPVSIDKHSRTVPIK